MADAGNTKVVFAAKVGFADAKKSVKIGNEVVENSKVIAADQTVTIEKDVAAGQTIVISGVKYVELYPSYSFTFTISK